MQVSPREAYEDIRFGRFSFNKQNVHREVSGIDTGRVVWNIDPPPGSLALLKKEKSDVFL